MKSLFFVLIVLTTSNFAFGQSLMDVKDSTYKLETILYQIDDNELKKYIDKSYVTSLKKGTELNFNKFKEERKQMATTISKEYNSSFDIEQIIFEVDTTSLGDKKYYLKIYIANR